MKFNVESWVLLSKINHVLGVVKKRNTIPILSNVLISVLGLEGTIRATDLDIEVVASFSCEGIEDGAITIPASMFRGIVSKLPKNSVVSIESVDNGSFVSIGSGRSRFSLQALPSEDFPDLAVGEMGNSFSISVAELKGLIEKTRFAISTDETRYYLNGIYLHDVASGPYLRAVATDGHRLAQAQVARPEGAAGMPGIIVPRKTVLEIVKLIEGEEGLVEISLSASKIRFSVGKLVLTSKLIDGTFPDYERVIPRNNDKLMSVETKVFANAVDRVSAISLDKRRAVKLTLGADKLTLVVNNPDSGSAEEEIAASYGSETIDIGFNLLYLLDVAGQIKSDEMHFLLANAGSPTIIKDPKDDQALYVLMPMRVR